MCEIQTKKCHHVVTKLLGSTVYKLYTMIRTNVFFNVGVFFLYAAVAVVFCYINQASMFLACIAINEHRTVDNRHFVTCRPVPTRKEAEEAGKSRRYILCCTGRKPRDINDTHSILDNVARWLVPKLVLPVFMKVIILIVFAGYLAASIYGLTKMKEGLNLKQLVADDSYYMKFGDWQEHNFPYVIPVSLIFDSPLKYSEREVQDQIEALLSNIKNEPTIKDGFEIHWLRSYQQYTGYNDSSETAFVLGLKSFLNITSNKRFENDVVFDGNRILYSRIYVMSVSIKDSQEQGNFMSRMREVATESPLPVFVHSGLFVFFEQYNAVLPHTLQNVGIAIVAVLLVTCVFMPHPVMILFITISVTMITVGIFGFHHYIDRTLSSVTSMLIVLSVGFSVDFSAHICHGYMISSGRDRNERTRAAIIRSGAPIFHGAMSTLLGVSVLAAGRSFITITFFKVMVIVLVFAIAHALLLLPVLLSLLGPNPSENKQRPDVSKYSKQYERRKHRRRTSHNFYRPSPYEPGYEYPFYISQGPYDYVRAYRYLYPVQYIPSVYDDVYQFYMYPPYVRPFY